MTRGPTISHKEAERLGWTRVDPKPWSKLSARWEHDGGWMLEHCGHPTAHYQWLLVDSEGQPHFTGRQVGNAETGTAWPDLRSAMEYVAAAANKSARRAPSAAAAKNGGPMEQQLTHIPLGKIHPSPNNPRKHPGELVELIASIREHGVIEPVIVRPRPKGGDFDLIAGWRRWLASQAAERPTIPAIVREDLDDDQAAEVTIIENLLREQVAPLEEADGFAWLVKHGRSASSIAEKIGKPAAYVAQRLRLCELAPAVRKALDEERITLVVAVLLARLPAKLQTEALDEVVDPHGFDPPMKADEAKKVLEERFLLRLESAPFDVTDAKLVPKAGACSACPKRSGAQRELFPDVKSPDLCTDPVCYRVKLDALWKLRVKDAKASGQKLLEGKAAKTALNKYGGDYKRLDGEEWVNDKRVQIRKLLGEATPPLVLAQDPETGAHVELVRAEDVDKVVRARDKLTGGRRRATADSGAGSRKRQAEKARIQAQVNAAAIAAAVDEAELLDTDKVLPWIVQGYARRAWDESRKAVVARRGLEPVKKKHYSGQATDNEATLLKAVRVADAEGLRGFGLELALLGVAPGSWGSSPMWSEAMKALGIDVAKIEAKVKAELAAKKAAKPKKRAPAPVAKPTKGKPKAKKRRARAEASYGA